MVYSRSRAGRVRSPKLHLRQGGACQPWSEDVGWRKHNHARDGTKKYGPTPPAGFLVVYPCFGRVSGFRSL